MYQTAEEMAHAGFVYTQGADGVCCFQCVVRLRQWAPHDDPWGAHHKWSPDCDYLKLTGLLKHRKQSVLPGCLALEYKRTTSHCTMYGHLGVTDGSPVSVGRVSDDSCRYAILDNGALEMCRSDGAPLVKIDTAEKQDIVRGLFNFKDYKNQKLPWIGLRDTTRSNVYRWTDGSVPTYTNWYKGEPSFTYGGQHEDCVPILSQTVGSVWNDDDCSEVRWFVCEM
ncbi:lectin BRA-3-like [Haliotis rufescens]|uniref:lectin BRA-3-like n=1 Tax=Haliotis rufescens TaxID=6454 RepID=UPI00201E78B1|nr:lectin BRA-3-like [Haliotis rufescens]